MATYRLMSILAHPDDETFGCAGTFYRAIQDGHQVAVVSATRGEAGEISNPALATKENLGQVREGELRKAMTAVGVNDVSFLDYLDGHLAEADTDEALARIVAKVRHFQPDVVITFAPNGVYGHPDHMAIHRLTIAALPRAADPAYRPDLGLAHRVHKVYYSGPAREMLLEMREQMRAAGQPDFIPGGNAATIPLEEMGTPREEITTIIALNDVEMAAKAEAAKAHATQIPADSPMQPDAQSDEMRRRFGFEAYALVPPPITDRLYPTPEADLFAGLD